MRKLGQKRGWRCGAAARRCTTPPGAVAARWGAVDLGWWARCMNDWGTVGRSRESGGEPAHGGRMRWRAVERHAEVERASA
eukprot:scaffold14379_cov121-Isochrysis_galbana.AAC.2